MGRFSGEKKLKVGISMETERKDTTWWQDEMRPIILSRQEGEQLERALKIHAHSWTN
jgi:hypothetical protein